MEPNYDAAARRERYLRERQLKGREKGSEDETSSGPRPPAAQPAPNQQAARAAAAARVKGLNEKLTKLRAALAAARKKSSDKPTAAESKSKDKAYNEDYYAKNKTKIANDRKAEARSSGGSKKAAATPATESRSVSELETAIRSTLVELKAAITKLRSL